jgi:hypothetical protein
MAKQPTTTKLTRRAAVALMGAGTVAAAVKAAPAKAAEGMQGKQECGTPALVETLGKGNRQAIASFSCCDETRNALLAGVEEPKIRPRPTGKAHLRPLRDRLTSDNLEEYCFMIWGLDEKQARSLYDTVPQQMGFERTKRETK